MLRLVPAFRAKAADIMNLAASTEEDFLNFIKAINSPLVTPLRQPLTLSLQATSSGLRTGAHLLSGEFGDATRNVINGVKEIIPQIPAAISNDHAPTVDR